MTWNSFPGEANGIPIAQDVQFSCCTPNGSVTGLDFSNYSFTWVNQTNAPISHLLIFPFRQDPNAAMGFVLYNLDDLEITKECNETVTVAPTVIEQCADGQAVVEYEVCLASNENAAVPLNLQASTNAGAFVAGGGFDQDGSANVTLTQPACTTLTLTVNTAGLQPGAVLNLNLTATSTDPCVDVAQSGGSINVTLIDCSPPEPLTCPCTDANTLNISASENGTLYSSLSLPTTLDPSVHNNCIAIAGRLIIDQNVTITDCDNIRMQPCAEIVVNGNQHLTMEYNTIYGCQTMWRSITVEPLGHLTFRHNEVSDAQHTLWVNPTNPFTLLFPTNVDIQHNRFERNHIGVHIPGNGGGFFGGVVWQTPFIGNNILCKGPGNPLGDLLPPCDAGLDNYDNEYGYAGVVALGANFNVGEPDGAFNTFSNLRNGVIAERVFLNVDRSNFNNMIGFSDFQPNFALSRGIGVVANRGWYNVRDANFNDAGHAVCSNFGILSMQRNSTDNVRFGLESWNPVWLGVLENQDIGFLDFGIRAWDIFGVQGFSSHIIDDNVFRTQNVQATTDGDWAIQLQNLSNLTLPDGAGRISRNEIYSNDQVSGLLVNNLNNWAISDNRAEFSAHPNSAILTNAGIQLQNSHYNNLYGNNIIDVTGIGYNATTGLANLASLGNRFCCNSTEGDFVGSLFLGSCLGTNYRQTDMAAHDFALWLPGNANTGFTIIGQQPIQVAGNTTNNNRFGAASGTARNDGDPQILDASRFFVTNQNTPHYPDFVSTPNGMPTDWFQTNGATPYECAQDVQCPDPVYPPDGREEIEPTDIEIAKNSFGSQAGGASLQWEGERDLYARLKAHPDMLGESAHVDAFYADKDASSAIQSFYIAETMVAAVQKVPVEWGQALQTAADSIEAIEAEADAVLTALAGVNNRADSLEIYWQSQSVRRRIVIHIAVVLEKQHQIDSLRRVRTLTTLPTVMALPANDVLQSNRKDALRVYLEVTSAGATRLTERQFDVISAIAHQCPLAGGSAVYMARALYQLNEQKHFDDFDLCAITDERSAKASPKPRADGLLLWPNPNTGQFHLYLPGINTEQQVQVRVTDLSGRAVLERNFATADGSLALDASRLAPGIYFCHIHTEGQVLAPVKFVIAH